MNDRMMLYLKEDGTLLAMKAPKSWEDLRGSGKEVFASFGGGEAFLKAERAAWDD